MALTFEIHLDDDGDLEDLRNWMDGTGPSELRLVPRAAQAGAQGSAWEFLSVLCAAAGPLTAAMRALQLWIESRVTVAKVVIGQRSVAIRSTNAAEVIPQLEKTALALLEADEARTDDTA